MTAGFMRLVEQAVDRSQFLPGGAGWIFFPRAWWPGYESRGFVVRDAALRERLLRRAAAQSIYQFLSGACVAGSWMLVVFTQLFWPALILALAVTAGGLALEMRYARDMRRELRDMPAAPGAKPPSWQVVADANGARWKLWLGFAGFGMATIGLLARAAWHLTEQHPPRWDGALAMAAMAALTLGLSLTYAIALRTRRLEEQKAALEAVVAERTAELERVNRHKSEFLANMSHELRTPLNAIIGFSDVMLSGMAGPMSDRQREFAGDIRDSGRHLLALINDILDLSKIEAGRMELAVAPFEVPVAASEALALVRERAERHRIRLASEIDADVGVCHGDARKVKQILLNLLTNAVKFTPPAGCVTLRVHREAADYRFAVEDTGVGIAPQDQEAIFEEFRQVGGDLERRAEGTGLGLALTRRLVALHGGTIEVRSAPGQGSTFTFNIPIG